MRELLHVAHLIPFGLALLLLGMAIGFNQKKRNMCAECRRLHDAYSKNPGCPQ